MYYIYILRCDDNSLYTGITNDLVKRLNEHYFKKPKAAAYTKAHQIRELLLVYQCENRSMASKLEYKIKKLSKSNKEKLITNPYLYEDEDYQVFEIKELSYYLVD